MSAAPVVPADSLDQLEAFAKSVQALSDSQLQDKCRNPETRAKILSIREAVQPWLLAMNRVANADRRLGKALNRTKREREV